MNVVSSVVRRGHRKSLLRSRHLSRHATLLPTKRAWDPSWDQGLAALSSTQPLRGHCLKIDRSDPGGKLFSFLLLVPGLYLMFICNLTLPLVRETKCITKNLLKTN